MAALGGNTRGHRRFILTEQFSVEMAALGGNTCGHIRAGCFQLSTRVEMAALGGNTRGHPVAHETPAPMVEMAALGGNTRGHTGVVTDIATES